jgi:tRNA(Glu) U13 pseudouridine synthase TruD
VRTSFSVGPHYDKALDDEFDTKQPYAIESLDLEPSARQSEERQPSRRYIIAKNSLKKALAREFSNFLFELFTVYEFINHEEYENALKVEHNLVRRFLVEVYKHYFNANYLITTKDLTEFIEHLVSDAQLPFTKEELLSFVEKYQIIDFEHENLALFAREVYEFISVFFDKIQLYIYKND